MWRDAYKNLYVQVLVAVAVGITLGHFDPQLGERMKPFGDGFINLVKMVIGPVIFVTIVVGMARMGDLRHSGRVGLKALIYFEVLTTLALVIGLVVANLAEPGTGLEIHPGDLDPKKTASYVEAAKEQSLVAFLLGIIPKSLVSAFVDNNLLQVLLVAVLFGVAMTQSGPAGRRVLDLLDELSQVLFKIVALVMRAAPIGAFGAMAFAIGKFGLGMLVSLGWLMLCVYATCFVFVFGVLGLVARWSGFSLWRFLVYIRREIVLVAGTSSSESALPRLLLRLEHAGCDRSVVGLVLPTGYSFNLDGTCIYLTMASIFIAQAVGAELTLHDELVLLGVLLLTSKGAAGITGAGFTTLIATLGALAGKVPVEGVALVIGVDRFMSEARAITNVIGNAVATMVVARWEGLRDDAKMEAAFAAGPQDALPETAPAPT
ncbi:MAG TPA: C4-dicarboxylate transporter DctA [Tahibacter sp.]|uniref:C4-dicarboxylate transporter DctA n=1 Tax=Tahibacter sp. TaxID=2056211 RepID=UPI002CC4DCD0|nr:C4-dicarboxylate transporter DctA [Tahibacter sp.]HSX61180.1 C4-dicarboxylate transporter DctA [Tahibacter sp.]